MYTADNNTAGHTIISTFSITDSCTVLHQNKKCKLILAGSLVKIYQFNNGSQTFEEAADITAELTTATINPQGSVVWGISSDCTRIRADSLLLLVTSSSSKTVISPNGLTFSQTDSELNYLLATNGSSVWRFSQSSNSYDSIYTPTTPFKEFSRIASSGDNVVVYVANRTSFEGYADV